MSLFHIYVWSTDTWFWHVSRYFFVFHRRAQVPKLSHFQKLSKLSIFLYYLRCTVSLVKLILNYITVITLIFDLDTFYFGSSLDHAFSLFLCINWVSFFSPLLFFSLSIFGSFTGYFCFLQVYSSILTNMTTVENLTLTPVPSSQTIQDPNALHSDRLLHLPYHCFLYEFHPDF